MLVLSRKENESILIGDDIKLIVTKIGGGRVRIGIEAPDDVVILRSEVKEKREASELPRPQIAVV